MDARRPLFIRCPGRQAIAIMALVASAMLLFAASSRSLAEEEAVTAPEGSRIGITGTAKAVARNSFRLDYGAEEILVEIGESQRYAEQRDRVDGKKVTVYGRLDRDFFDRETLYAIGKRSMQE